MMEVFKKALFSVVISVVILPGLAHAQQCTQTTEITSEASVEISASPAIVCSVQFIATAADGWGLVFDSPSNTGQQSSEHAQLRRVAEPAQSTAYNSIAHPFGDYGFHTNFGLGAFVVRGRMIVEWDS